MTQDKNDFDEQLELDAICEARKHDDPIGPLLIAWLFLITAIGFAVMLSP